MISINLRVFKKLGKPGLEYAGIYQRYPTAKRQIIRFINFYVQSNPQTIPQEANRNKLAVAVSNWQGLTQEQKNVYNERAKRRQFSGYNLFIGEYIKNN